MVTSGKTDLTQKVILLSACVCTFLRTWQQAAIISRHSINGFVTIKENKSVYSAVRTGCLCFEGKTVQEVHQRGLVLARQCPGSPGTCNPEETGLPGLPMSWLPTLISGSGPFGLPPFPWTEKKRKVRHFSSNAEATAATETWLDGQISEFFWVDFKS